MSNVQSVITATNGSAIEPMSYVSKADKAKAAKAARAKALASVAMPATMTALQACDAAFEYGSSLAGLDGTLTLAVKAFKDNATVMADMLTALNVGYVMRKLGYDKAKATETVGKLKYNEKKEGNDHYRTFEQQRVLDTVRVVWHRVQKMAGVVKAPSEGAIKAEATRAQKEADKAAHEARLIKADAIVNPADDIDAFDALSRLALTMKSLANKYSGKLTGDRGTAWRDWLANAPK